MKIMTLTFSLKNNLVKYSQVGSIPFLSQFKSNRPNVDKIFNMEPLPIVLLNSRLSGVGLLE